MTITLKQIIHSIFRKRFERCGEYGNLKPYFYRFIGVDDNTNYDNTIRTLKEKFDEHRDRCIIFDNSIPMNGEMELIQHIYTELENMNVLNMQSEEIVLFDDSEINLRFLNSLDYVIPLAIQNEKFFNESVRNNFITKLIVWAYSFLREIQFKEDINPKCIYYGTIERHEIYFLIVLYLMNFDVIYINPLKEEYFKDIDVNNLSECIQSMSILSIESFSERAAKGEVIENVETITKQIQRDVQHQLFENTGIYKPWQFRGGYTKSVLLDTILEDIFIYWNEPSRVRDGFKVEGDTVKIPCFFKKIDGQYRDEFEFQRLVKCCSESSNTIFLNSGDILKEASITDDMYQLMFCQLSDGTFDIDEMKKVSLYKFEKYSPETQNFILSKFNELILNKNIFVTNLNKELILKLLVLILDLDDKYIKMIDNFDFTGNIPKLVIYLNNEDTISETMVMILGYFHIIGIDIVIFNPSGLFNINNVLSKDAINVIRLEEMNYNSKYKSIINLKQSIFSRILKR